MKNSKNGYDKFFKEAQRAAGLSAPRPTDTAVQKLRQRKRQRALRRRQPFPVVAFMGLIGIFAAVAIAYYRSAEIEEMLSRVEIGIFGAANASEDAKASPAKESKGKEAAGAKEKTAETGEAKEEKDAATKTVGKNPEPLNIKQWTPEELSFFSKLSERKKELDLREAELNKLEEELQKRKGELDQKLKALEAMRADISKTLKSRVASDQEKVDKLVQVYSSMKAAQAAKVIETLNEDLAVEILDKMKKKSAAEVLDMMNAKKARRLSELLTGYQRSPASAEGEEATETGAAAQAPAEKSGTSSDAKK